MGELSGITKGFLEKALGFPIDKFEVKAGSSVGDGYASAMVGVDVWKKSESHDPLSIVIKCYPENQSRQEFLENTNIFEVELGMYDTVIPALIKLQDYLPEHERLSLPFAPFIFGEFVKPQDRQNLGRPLAPMDNCIVLPDLRKAPNGAFTLRDRFLGFDLDHQKLAIEGHARIHAVSWAYKCKRGLDSLFLDFPSLNNDMSKSIKPYLASAEAGIQMNKEVFQDNPEILQALDHLKTVYPSVAGFFYGCDLGQNERGHTKDNVLRKPGHIVENEGKRHSDTGFPLPEIFTPPQVFNPSIVLEPWKVLVHNDSWSNNMMFRYDEKTGRPVEVVFIDLQFCNESDPMNDICSTLFYNSQPDLRRKHLQSLLHVYFDTFTEICQKLDVPPLPGWSWEEFNRRFRRATIGGAYAALEFHVILKNEDAVENMDDTIAKLETTEEGTKKDGVDSVMGYFTGLSKVKNFHPAFKPRITGVFEDLIKDGVL